MSMSYELLETVTGLLTAAGIPAGEEYPALEQPQLESPRAAVGLRELDAGSGTARFRVKVLSPRLLGGWCCQVWGARTVRALTDGGLDCRTEEMAYHSGSDCFCVTVEALMAVVPSAADWEPGVRWQVLCSGSEQTGVVSFTANRSLQRRLVGTHWKSEPVAITSGTGGWQLELVQELAEEPVPVPEPFVLAVREGDREHRYTGCCWNETVWEYVQSGARLTRRGFALGREEVSNG